MGVFKEIVLLPAAPFRFTLWVVDQVAQDVDRRTNSPAAHMQKLREIEAMRDRGELHEEQAAQMEAEVIEAASGPQPTIDKGVGAEDG